MGYVKRPRGRPKVKASKALSDLEAKPVPDRVDCVISFAQLRNQGLNETLMVLVDRPVSFDFALKLWKIIDAISKVIFQTDVEWQALRSAYLNQDGILRSDLPEEDKFKGAGEINNFLIRKVNLEVERLPKAEVEALGLKAKELILLDGLVG